MPPTSEVLILAELCSGLRVRGFLGVDTVALSLGDAPTFVVWSPCVLARVLARVHG